MAEHTPGPWYYRPTNFGHPDNRINPIVEVDQNKMGGVAYICRVGWQGSTIPGMTSLTVATLEEAEANAKLLAAAPQMLAALKAIVSHPLKHSTDQDGSWSAIRDAEMIRAQHAVEAAGGSVQ
ncbi:hypothetical protein LCGC14_2697330 [marine sediment metagenome]|uniref:Uncharacterized protein n=1 Tax=marine sediment metagenome TaxID=412755 RepID=A0A0F8ZGQ0_9ZZZZ